jgi:hypothetical protein
VARAHLYKVLQNGNGSVMLGATVRVLQKNSTTPLTDTLYTSESGTGTLANPFISSDGRIEFYLNEPRRIRLGITPAGGSEFFHTTDVMAPADEAVTAPTHLRITDMPVAGEMMRGTGSDSADWEPFGAEALPYTTPGDLVYLGLDSMPARIGIGGDAQVLTVVGGVPAWADATGGHEIQNAGTPLAQRGSLNFIGAAVTVTDDSVNDATDVEIDALTEAAGDARYRLLSSPGGHTIQEEGVSVPTRTYLDFIGSSVTVTDDAANDKTLVTISGTGGGGSAAAPTWVASAVSSGPGAGAGTINVPGGLAVGDVVLWVTRGSGAVTPPFATEVEDSTANGGNYYSLGWHRLTSGDLTGTWVFTGALDVGVAIYRGVVGDPVFPAATKITTLSATSVVMPAVTGVTPYDRVVRLLGTASNGDPTPTFTAGATQRVSNRQSTYWAVGIADAVPSSDTAPAVTATWPGSSDYVYTSVTLHGSTSTITDPTISSGDMIYRGASNITRLPIGTNGKYLKVVGGLPSWEDGYASPLTTRGDLVYRGASGDTRLPIGAAGYVLMSDGTDPAWSPSTALFGRTTVSYVTGALASGAYEVGRVTMGKGWRLLRIVTDVPARVRLYTTEAKRDADLTRIAGNDPAADSGLLLDFVTTAALLSADLAPVVDGMNAEGPVVITTPITVTNTAASAVASITVTFTFVRTE